MQRGRFERLGSESLRALMTSVGRTQSNNVLERKFQIIREFDTALLSSELWAIYRILCT